MTFFLYIPEYIPWKIHGGGGVKDKERRKKHTCGQGLGLFPLQGSQWDWGIWWTSPTEWDVLIGSVWRTPPFGDILDRAEPSRPQRGMLLSPTIPFPRVLGQSRGSEWILSTSSPGSTERPIWPSHRKARTLQVWIDLDWSRSVLRIHSEGWQLFPSCKPFFFHSCLYSVSLDDQLIRAGLGLFQFSNWKSCVPGTPSVLGNLGCLIILLFCHQ